MGAQDTAAQCSAQGATARAWTVDVGEAGQITAAVADFVREWGAPDGLVNNAGIFPRSRALDMQLAEWERVLRVNLTGTFLCAQAVAAHMKAAGRGVIVNTASGRALGGAANGAHYASTKGGILALMALIRHTLKDRKKIRRMALLLGLIGASLFYGDSMITPAISVMSAIEGLSVINPAADQIVLPAAILILTVLFAIQRKGTDMRAANAEQRITEHVNTYAKRVEGLPFVEKRPDLIDTITF